jgi:MFS family permease
MSVASVQEPLLKSQHGDMYNDEQRSRGWFASIPKRYWLTLCAFFGFFNVYTLRVCLSVAIEPMAKQYGWSTESHGLLLSSFFIGYLLTQVVGGVIAQRVGGKHLLTFAVLITSVLTLLTPIVAETGSSGVVVLRVLEGFGEGVSFPAMHFMFSMWSPMLERSRLAGFGYSGAYLGTIIAFPVSGLLCAGTFLGGWPATFYVFGALGVLWCIWWHFTVYSHPEQHPTISQEELVLIKAGRDTAAAHHTAGDVKRAPQAIPWFKIFTNKAVIALVIGQFAANWSFYTCLTLGPTFLNRALNFDITQSGFLNALPYIGIFIVYVGAGRGADFFIEHGYSRTLVRRSFQAASMVLSACAFAGMGQVLSSSDAVVLMTLAVSMLGLNAGGIMVNQIDLGPELAGVLMGISNTIGTLPGIISPLLSSAMLGNDSTSPEKWSMVFYVSAAIGVFSALVYGLAGSGNRQF